MLRDRTILVIGCTAGIGAAIYRLCAEAGAEVIGVGRSADKGQALADTHGGRFHALDICDAGAVDDFYRELRDKGVVIDGAVNNAAMSQDAGNLDEFDLDLFDTLFALNVRAAFNNMRWQMRSMRRRGGSIVNIASIAGLRGLKGLSIYSASKHALIGLTRTAALDGAADHIRVNAVAPGTTRTEMFDRQMTTRPGGEQGTVAAIPLGRVAMPEEPAQAALWLLSDQASFVTGETLTVDGGRTVS